MIMSRTATFPWDAFPVTSGAGSLPRRLSGRLPHPLFEPGAGHHLVDESP